MKITPIGRVFGEKGWTNYSVAQLESADLERAKDAGADMYMSGYIAQAKVEFASYNASDEVDVFAAPHPILQHAYLVTCEVRLNIAPAASRSAKRKLTVDNTTVMA